MYYPKNQSSNLIITDLKTAQIYAKVTDQKVSDDMRFLM
jgi:hypothetical protein